MRPFSARNILSVLVLIVASVECIPGTTSIKQCYKYNNIPISLRDLNSYKPPSKEDINNILEEESEEGEGFFRRVSREALNNTGISSGIDNMNVTDDWLSAFLPTTDGEPNIVGAVGGQDALPYDYPFMAALGYGNESNKKYLCGGSLINEDFVLTAAHCIFSPDSGIVKYIRLGDTNIVISEDDEFVQEFKMSNYHIHPQYSYQYKHHDIALVKLDKPAIFTKGVLPACLEHERKSLKDVELRATGWGLLGYGERSSDILQEVRLRHYTPKSCQKTYNNGQEATKGFIDEYQICAGTITNLTDTCQGDSGGPLVYYSKRNGPDIKYLVGITSYGVACGIAELPAIYTRVSYYIDWIENIVWPKK